MSIQAYLSNGGLDRNQQVKRSLIAKDDKKAAETLDRIPLFLKKISVSLGEVGGDKITRTFVVSEGQWNIYLARVVQACCAILLQERGARSEEELTLGRKKPYEHIVALRSRRVGSRQGYSDFRSAFHFDKVFPDFYYRRVRDGESFDGPFYMYPKKPTNGPDLDTKYCSSVLLLNDLTTCHSDKLLTVKGFSDPFITYDIQLDLDGTTVQETSEIADLFDQINAGFKNLEYRSMLTGAPKSAEIAPSTGLVKSREFDRRGQDVEKSSFAKRLIRLRDEDLAHLIDSVSPPTEWVTSIPFCLSKKEYVQHFLHYYFNNIGSSTPLGDLVKSAEQRHVLFEGVFDDVVLKRAKRWFPRLYEWLRDQKPDTSPLGEDRIRQFLEGQKQKLDHEQLSMSKGRAFFNFVDLSASSEDHLSASSTPSRESWSRVFQFRERRISPLIERISGWFPGERMTKKSANSAIQTLQRNRGVCVLQGEAGSGKSVTLRQYCLSAINKGLNAHKAVVPIYVALKSYNQLVERKPEEVWRLIYRELEKDSEGRSIISLLPFLFWRRRLIFVFDGLDEMDRFAKGGLSPESEDSLYIQKSNELARFADELSKVGINCILSCRTHQLSLSNHRSILLNPLARRSILLFIDNIIGGRFPICITQEDGTSFLCDNPDEFLAALEGLGMEDEVENPLFLSLLCYFIASKPEKSLQWPVSRGELYVHYIESIIESKGGLQYDKQTSDLKYFLSELSYHLFVTRGGASGGITNFYSGKFTEREVIELSETAARLGFVQKGDEHDPNSLAVSFGHYGINQHLAAQFIIQNGMRVEWEKVLDEPGWRDVILNIFYSQRVYVPLIEALEGMIAAQQIGVADLIKRNFSYSYERLLADRLLLASEIIRISGGGSHGLEALEESVRQKFTELSKCASPPTRVTLVRVVLNIAGIDPLPIYQRALKKGWNSEISWVKAQTLDACMKSSERLSSFRKRLSDLFLYQYFDGLLWSREAWKYVRNQNYIRILRRLRCLDLIYLAVFGVISFVYIKEFYSIVPHGSAENGELHYLSVAVSILIIYTAFKTLSSPFSVYRDMIRPQVGVFYYSIVIGFVSAMAYAQTIKEKFGESRFLEDYAETWLASLIYVASFLFFEFVFVIVARDIVRRNSTKMKSGRWIDSLLNGDVASQFVAYSRNPKYGIRMILLVLWVLSMSIWVCYRDQGMDYMSTVGLVSFFSAFFFAGALLAVCISLKSSFGVVKFLIFQKRDRNEAIEGIERLIRNREKKSFRQVVSDGFHRRRQASAIIKKQFPFKDRCRKRFRVVMHIFLNYIVFFSVLLLFALILGVLISVSIDEGFDLGSLRPFMVCSMVVLIALWSRGRVGRFLLKDKRRDFDLSREEISLIYPYLSKAQRKQIHQIYLSDSKYATNSDWYDWYVEELRKEVRSNGPEGDEYWWNVFQFDQIRRNL